MPRGAHAVGAEGSGDLAGTEARSWRALHADAGIIQGHSGSSVVGDLEPQMTFDFLATGSQPSTLLSFIASSARRAGSAEL